MDVVTLALARESAENAGAYLIDLTQSPIQQKILELFGVGGGSQVGVEGVTNKFWDDIPVERPLMVTLLFNGDLYLIQVTMLKVNMVDDSKFFIMTLPMVQSGQITNVNISVSQSNGVDIKAYVTVIIG